MNKLPAYENKPIPDGCPITSYGEIINAKEAVKNCKAGYSFTVDTHNFRQRVIGFARRAGIEVKTKKNDSGRYDIWRL